MYCVNASVLLQDMYFLKDVFPFFYFLEDRQNWKTLLWIWWRGICPIVETEGFRVFVNKLHPSYILPNWKAQENSGWQESVNQAEGCGRLKKKADFLSLTADMWSSIKWTWYLMLRSHRTHIEFESLFWWGSSLCSMLVQKWVIKLDVLKLDIFVNIIFF